MTPQQAPMPRAASHAARSGRQTACNTPQSRHTHKPGSNTASKASSNTYFAYVRDPDGFEIELTEQKDGRV